jgi:hypothetical protein
VPWILLSFMFPSQVPPPQLSARATPLAATSAVAIAARMSIVRFTPVPFLIPVPSSAYCSFANRPLLIEGETVS